jgi:hypothetical protein
MNRVFDGHGIHFEYPEDWILHEQSTPEEITVTVNSPETSFWSLTLLLDRPDPYRVVETVIDALREDYSEVDVYTNEGRLGDLSAVARDVDFVCHELIGSAFIRSAVIPGGTLLVLYQGADFELEETQSLLERISKSLTWEASTEPRVLDVLDLFELAEEGRDADELGDSLADPSADDD